MGKIKAMRIPEGAVVIGEHMYFKTAQNVDLKDLSEMELKKMAIRDNIKAENDAIMMYSKYIDLLPAGDPVRKGLEAIRDEEKEHAGELHQLLVTLDPSELRDFNEGVGEVKREQGVKSARARKKASGNPYLHVATDGSGGLLLELSKDGEYSIKLPTANVPRSMGFGDVIDLDEGVLDEYEIDPDDDAREIGYIVDDYLEEQGYYDVSASGKDVDVKKTALDWEDDGDIIPGSFSAVVADGSEVVVLPPEETGFDGYVVYRLEDSALVDAIGDSLLRPKPFLTADDAKDAAEKWVEEKSGSAKNAKKGAARKHAAGVPAFDEFEFDVDDDVWRASTYDGDYNISGDEGKYMWRFDNGPEYVESDGFVFDSPQEAYRDMVRNSDAAAIRTYSARNAAGKKSGLLVPEPLERFEDEWDGNMYACTTEDGAFFVKRASYGLEGAGSFEWIVLWNLGGSDGRNGFETPRDAFDDMLRTLYVEERRGSVMRVANGWSTDGITCTLEEDDVKLFVEPELDKWRWDVNVDGELFDTGLADSMPEAQICAEDCAEDAIGHSFIAEKTERDRAKGKRHAKRGKHAKRRKRAGLLLDWQDMGGGQYVVKGDLCDGVVFDDGGSWSWRLYDPKRDRFDDTYGYYGDGLGSKEEAMDDIERSLNALKRMFGSSSSKVDEAYNEKRYGR